MKVIVQRVKEASVDIAGTTEGSIGAGLVVLVGIEARDTLDDVKWLAKKVWNMRLWSNSDGKPWMESAKGLKYELLVISQFTLHARFKGNKPDFHHALAPEKVSAAFVMSIPSCHLHLFATCHVTHVAYVLAVGGGALQPIRRRAEQLPARGKSASCHWQIRC